MGLLGQTQGGLYGGLIGDVVQEEKTGGNNEADEEVWQGGEYRRGWSNLMGEQVEQSVTLRLPCPFELMVEQ